MRKFLSLLLMLCVATCAFTVQSCSDDDEPAAPWVPETVKPILTGVVNTNGGVALAGATVSVGGKTATTDATGAYTITDLTAGTAEVKVSMGAEYSEKVGNVMLEDDAIATFNAVLIKANTKTEVETNVADPTGTSESGTVDAVYSTETPNATSDAAAATQTVSVVVENKEEIFEDPDDELILSSSIDVTNTNTKASVGSGITSMTLNTKSGKAPKKDVKVAVKTDVKPSKITHAGKEVTNFEQAGDYFFFNTKELGTTNIYYEISSTSVKTSSNPLSFSQSVVSGPVTSTTVTYTYQVGSQMNSSAGGVLGQFVTLIAGTSNVQSKTGEVRISNVPAGVSAQISGSQAVTTTTYSYSVASTGSVSITNYGAVSVQRTDNRQHTGGSN